MVMRRMVARSLFVAGRHPHVAIWAMENFPFLMDQLQMFMAFLGG